MYTIVLLRHGESVWNKANRFTGWTDVDLTEQGESEAREAGRILSAEGYSFDLAYTSVLKRAIRTLWLALEELDLVWLPVLKSWRLNERHYGALQGLNKAEMTERYGEEQVHVWRRSYDTPPPALDPDDERFPGKDRRYSEVTEAELPRTECLRDTVRRFLPYYEREILPVVREGRRVLIAAHGNSLRALVKILDGLSDEEIVGVNIPTGVPLVYRLNDDLSVSESFYLGDQDEINAAIESVRNQAKGK